VHLEAVILAQIKRMTMRKQWGVRTAVVAWENCPRLFSDAKKRRPQDI
jgi:hypothetical protein